METRGVHRYPPLPSVRLSPGFSALTLPGKLAETKAVGNSSSGYITYARPDKEIRPAGNYASQRSSISRFDFQLNTRQLVDQQSGAAMLLPPNANVMRIVGRARDEDPVLTNTDGNLPPPPGYNNGRLRDRQHTNRIVRVAPGVNVRQ